jgi:hypothetical protein
MSNTIDTPPHYMNPDEDCMGNPVPGYWRQFLECSDGKTVCGTGKTAEEAITEAQRLRNLREQFIAEQPRTRIQKILAKYDKNEYPSAQDQGDFNRAVAEILGCI